MGTLARNGLSKLSDVGKNEVIKKTKYNESVKKFNAIQTTDTNHLVKETDYGTKIGDIEEKILDYDHAKYITIQEFNKLMTANFTARLKQVSFVSVETTDFHNKLKMLRTTTLLSVYIS